MFSTYSLFFENVFDLHIDICIVWPMGWNQHNVSPLHLSSREGETYISELLIKRGATVDALTEVSIFTFTATDNISNFIVFVILGRLHSSSLCIV